MNIPAEKFISDYGVVQAQLVVNNAPGYDAVYCTKNKDYAIPNPHDCCVAVSDLRSVLNDHK